MRNQTASKKPEFISPEEPLSGEIDNIKRHDYLWDHYLVIRIDKSGNSGEPLEGALVGYTKDRLIAYTKLRELREGSVDKEHYIDFAHSQSDKKTKEIFIV